jgi:hypothetical protein
MLGVAVHRRRGKITNKTAVPEKPEQSKVINSTQYEKRLVEILTEAQERGEEIRIVVSYDR